MTQPRLTTSVKIAWAIGEVGIAIYVGKHCNDRIRCALLVDGGRDC